VNANDCLVAISLYGVCVIKHVFKQLTCVDTHYCHGIRIQIFLVHKWLLIWSVSSIYNIYIFLPSICWCNCLNVLYILYASLSCICKYVMLSNIGGNKKISLKLNYNIYIIV